MSDQAMAARVVSLIHTAEGRRLSAVGDYFAVSIQR